MLLLNEFQLNMMKLICNTSGYARLDLKSYNVSLKDEVEVPIPKEILKSLSDLKKL